MLKPVIMIGCGGSGQKAVRYVRDAVRRRLMHAGWEGEFPRAWQFIGIDTLTVQEDPSIPFLPATDYLSVALAFNQYYALNQALEAKFPKGSDGFREMMGWRPRPDQVMVPLTQGAGQIRAVGRTAGVLALQSSVQQRIRKAFGDCAAGGPQLAEVSQKLGVVVPPGTPTPKPLVIIAGSLAGGTGAGIMLDVVDLVRRTHLDGAYPVLVGFTPDIFGSIQNDQMVANSAAFMAEMMSAYWDNEGTDAALIPATVNVKTRGPHSVFLIGRKNMDGLDLTNSKNVYRAVGEALAAITTSARVQEEFSNYVQTNWPRYTFMNGGGYGFPGATLPAVLSSFGSTTISIGRDRFREYLEKLLQRSVIEFLTTGYEQSAVAVLGENATKSLAGEAKISELARRYRDEFIADCGLQEKGNSNQVTNIFASPEALKAEFQVISAHLKRGMNPAAQLTPSAWMQMINAEAQQARTASLKRAEEDTASRQKDWTSKVCQLVLRASTDYSARLSIPVVLKMLELLRAEVLEVAGEMRAEAENAKQSAVQARDKARTHLDPNGKGNIALTASPVQDTISDTAKSIGWEWNARVREQLSVTLESVATALLNSVEAGLRQGLNKLNTYVTPQDGMAPVVSAWPSNDDTVPANFAPSPVEFYLEGHETWPARAKELIERSLGVDRATLSGDPIQAARTLIIRGGYSFKKDSTVAPLIWAETFGGREPNWSVGDMLTVTVDDSLDRIGERIDAWLSRPSTDISFFLSEGLSEYLSARDQRKGGIPVADHAQRLSIFRQKLQEALNQSRPLLEIDKHLYPTVHPQPLSTMLNVQGFPFGDGHPAREITEAVIQGFMNTAESLDALFTPSESESVLISTFLEYPVHPSVATSFTEPFGVALGKVANVDLLRSSFWQWCRARILENFVPLPDGLRLSAVRGFAIARALGYTTASKDEQNSIITSEGTYYFPKWLLTKTTQANVLPALLEAMILTFAEVPTKGKAAFDAYRALLEYGGGSLAGNEFDISGDLRDYILHGRLNLEPIDRDRATALRGALDQGSRIEIVSKYLKANLDRFIKIQREPLLDSHWRDGEGFVDPNDTLSLELIEDLKLGYSQVLDAIGRLASGEEVIA